MVIFSHWKSRSCQRNAASSRLRAPVKSSDCRYADCTGLLIFRTASNQDESCSRCRLSLCFTFLLGNSSRTCRALHAPTGTKPAYTSPDSHQLTNTESRRNDSAVRVGLCFDSRTIQSPMHLPVRSTNRTSNSDANGPGSVIPLPLFFCTPPGETTVS